MSANSQEIVQRIRTEFEAVLTDLLKTHPEAAPTADTIERNLWQQMLNLGASLMGLFLVNQAQSQVVENLTTPAGDALQAHDYKERTYHCVFGKLHFQRRYYYRPGSGAFPLDATLNLPPEATSDMLREWQERLGMYLAYQESNTILEGMLGRPFSSRILQEAILADAQHVPAFYAQADPHLPDPAATILVVQADGKGVPMLTDPQEAPVRRSKGQKPCRKKEAIATSVYTLAPTPRTPQSVVTSLFHPTPEEQKTPRPRPYHKWLWATLDGKEAALAFTAKQVARQNRAHIAHRVALTDGSEALQTRVQTQFPDFTLVLDFIHADEYLWKAANALLGETALERTDWVEARTLQMLCGQTIAVVSELRQLADGPGTSAGASKTLLSVAAYYERNLSFMEYDRYLALGWPIATGVIEGACRHLVKDRCEQSGMRWTQAGAEALLRLRSVSENGDWAAFHEYRRCQRQKTVYAYWPRTAAKTSDAPATPLRLAA
jgi:hypothetical protein